METGTIISIAPTQTGGYQGKQGYIYTYDIIINAPSGRVGGEIGSKVQPYPLAVNDQISFEATQGQYGTRIKKVNPQYANQQPTQQQPRQQPPQGRQQANQPDWDKIAEGKVRNSVVCAFISNGVEPPIEAVKKWTDYIMTGALPQPTPNEQPNYNDQRQLDEDGIPF
jgi:hypothetical protein